MDEEFIKGLEKKEEKDYTAAIKHFKISAIEGNSQALFEIGQIYFYSLHRLADALSWYRKAVKKHNTDAMVAIANCYRYGLCVKQNYKYAFMYNERAAMCGNEDAMLELHEHFYFGLGVKKNRKKEFYWLRRSAVQGNEIAMYDLASRYLGYDGMEKDYRKAVYWYERSAQSIILDDTIGDLYFFGENCYDPYEWYYNTETENFFLDNDIYARILLDIFESQFQNLGKAVFWYKKCATGGNTNSKKKLGYLYEKGIYVKKSLRKSLYWYNAAEEKNNS